MHPADSSANEIDLLFEQHLDMPQKWKKHKNLHGL